MDFREFYKKFAQEQIHEAKKKKPDADGDGVPDWADKKHGEDDHADDKKKDKKKSLKDWFEQVNKEMIAEQQVMPGIKQNLEIKTGSAPATRITDPQTGTTIVTSEPSVVAAAKTGKLTLDKQLKEKENKDKPNLKHLKRQYRDNEASNAHTENAVLLATHFGDDTEVAHARAALKHRDQQGGYSSDDKEAKKHLQRLHKIHTKYGHKLSENVIEEAEKWIQNAIKKPGALKKQLGVPKDEKIPAGKLAAAAKKGGKLGQRARLAQTLKSINKEGYYYEDSLDEKITKKTPAGEIISDFEKSKNKKFKGKSKEKRKEMALGAYYGMHPEKSKKKVDEVDQPLDGDQLGPGSHSARSKYVLEKTQVNEAMDTRKVAYHEGKAMGLQHKHACKYNEGSEEHKSFHEGFMKGIEECYNSGVKNMPIVGMEEDSMPPATVPGMASAAMPSIPTMEDEMEEGTLFTGNLAKARAAGKTMADLDGDGDMEKVRETSFAFESLEQQLNALLNEDAEPVVEGLSVSMSTGQQGAADSVSVTGTDDEAAKLLAFIKQVGLGGMGGEEPKAEVVTVTGSDYGGPSFQGYDNPDMAKLLQKVGVDDHEQDYKDEAGHEEDHGGTCNECGMHEAKCGCEKSVEETQTPDQLEADSISEDDGEGYTASQADAGKIDSALALSGASKGGAMNEGMAIGDDYYMDIIQDLIDNNRRNMSPSRKPKVMAYVKREIEKEGGVFDPKLFDQMYKQIISFSRDIYEGGDGMEDEPVSEAKKHKKKESTAEKDDKAEKAGKKVAKDIEYDEGHKGKDDEKAEKAGKKVAKDIEYDDKKDKKKKVDEWANDAGKDSLDAAFEQDIEFMMNIISGGLNKPKSTGQQTIPVLAGDEARTNINEDIQSVIKLAGIK